MRINKFLKNLIIKFKGAGIREDGAKAMRLPKWNNDVRVKVQNLDGTLCNTHPYLYVESRFGRVPWIPNYVEMFSKDWEIV